MTTTPEGRRELKALAEAAAPGPWSTEHTCFDRKIPINGGITAFGRPYVIAHVNRPGSAHAGRDKANAAFIAAANPATVLALLAENEELRARSAASEQREAGLRAQIDGLRPEVLAFAHLMEAKLRANDYKPGWKSEFAADLFPRIAEEAEELRQAIEEHARAVNWGDMSLHLAAWTKRVGSEAADVANFALMIADVCGALTTKSGDDEEARYRRRVASDLASVVSRDLAPDFPNYADWPVTLPAGHWRDLVKMLPATTKSGEA